ncbi:MAG: hypothetical protein JRN20_03205 [Nitrososphaerota archaeon]|nr:hypothetical protein [Nitrososphaerota archaeon]
MVIALLISSTWSFQNSQARQQRLERATTSEQYAPSFDSSSLPTYILAGGQNGQWFSQSQYPELYRVVFSGDIHEAAPLFTVSGSGTVWTGGWNGSSWLITGWGDSQGLNPYFEYYDSVAETGVNSSNYAQASAAESEWSGGDIFSSTWNGSMWLLTGMGSGALEPDSWISNHYSMAFLTRNGTFIDISSSIPNNSDGILYTSSWNGNYWLVGGGYYGFDNGILLEVFSDGTIVDVTSSIGQWVPELDSIQSIAWNGTDWMIGGVGFLAEYNPSTGGVYDLTGSLDSALGTNDSLGNAETNSINSIVWTGSEWMIAGGVPIAFEGTEKQAAWVAVMDTNNKASDLTAKAIPPSILTENSMSSILSMACDRYGCVLGGFAGDNPVLLWYNGQSTTNLSVSLPSGGMTYVEWVGVSDEVFV